MAVSDLNRPSHRLAGGHGEAPYEWPDLALQENATQARIAKQKQCHMCGVHANGVWTPAHIDGQELPLCDNCWIEYNQGADEVDAHELSNFGGAYGLVSRGTWRALANAAIEQAAQVDATHARVLRRLLESDSDPRDTRRGILDANERSAIEAAIDRMER